MSIPKLANGQALARWTITRLSKSSSQKIRLNARFRSGFILLSPTARFVTVSTQEMLANARVGFFDLETHTTLLPGGALHARRSGAHLFSPYLTKRSDPIEKGEANRVFALMKTLDGGSKLRKAPLEQVFRLLII